MKKVFQDKNKMECIFMDDGIVFRDSRQDIYFPYGCLDSLNMSFFGVMQAVSRTHKVCAFSVAHKDRAEIKEMMQFARTAMGKAPSAEPVVMEKGGRNAVDASLPAEEQLQQLKTLFIQGAISKDAYDMEKRLLKN